jgi:hypothetical protein
MRKKVNYIGLIVANLLYDCVLKAMLQETWFASYFIGKLLGLVVMEIELLATEQIIETDRKYRGKPLRYIRYDFKALLADQHGRKLRVMLELQWRPNRTLLIRFRNYLGKELVSSYSSYSSYKSDNVEKWTPIASIYILGHKLPHLDRAVVSVERTIIDKLTSEVLSDLVVDPFIDSFSHEFVIVQTPRLAGCPLGDLEDVLFLFNPDYVMTTDNKHELALKNIPDSDFARRSAELAHRLVSDPETRLRMDIEDELYLEWELQEADMLEERRQKEAAIAREEEERRKKEAAIVREEEERRKKEAAQSQLKAAIKVFLKQDKTNEEIADIIGVSVDEITKIVNDLLLG